MLTGAAPLTDDEAVELFRRWFAYAARPLLLAVSGGPDSIALMHLAAAAAKSLAGAPPLHVATVDHGLRPEARGEAEQVLRAAGALGLPATLLPWTGAKPATGLQEAAREARYRLLRDCAHAIGASAIMTAHTLDDQAETVLLRLLRGSGPGGLAAMRQETPLGDIRLIRPLLGTAKARLVVTCRAQGWTFVEDPSNQNDRFTRVRMRKLLAAFEGEGLSAARLARLAERSRRAEEALDAQARAAFDLLCRVEGGAVALDAAGYRNQAAEMRVRLVTLSLSAMAGHLPVRPALRLERIESVAARFDRAIDEKKSLRTTCGGCRIILSQGKIAFIPEEARQRGQNRDKPSRRPQLGFSPSAP